MSNVFTDHKRHKAIIKGASKQFTQATSNRKGAIICWVLLGSLLMKGGDIGHFPDRWETPCGINVIKQVGKKGEMYEASKL